MATTTPSDSPSGNEATQDAQDAPGPARRVNQRGGGGVNDLRRVLRQQRGQPHFLREINRFLRVLGPGLITGAADDDPSGIGTYSQTGAAYGPALLWMALYLLPFMIVVQEMCGRIGIVTGQGIAGVLRRCYSRRILYAAVALLFLANTINVGADLGAMAASVQLLVPGAPFVVMLVVISLGVLALEIFVPYRYYAQVLKFLALSLLAYVATGILIGGDWLALLRATIIPTIEPTPAYLALLVAIIGTTISPYLFFWQASEEVEEEELIEERKHPQASQQQRSSPPKGRSVHAIERRKKLLNGQLKGLWLDTIFGMLAATVTFWFIVMATNGTLHLHNITNIATAAQAAQALEPLVKGFPHAGFIAEVIFAMGILGTGLLAVPVLAGSAAYGVAEAFGWREGLARPLWQARGFYAVIAASTLIGLALNFFGVNPIQALVYAAVINGIVAVPLLALILLVANNKRIMGDFTNGRLSNIVGIITCAGMGLAAVITIVTLFVP
ncbi:MAG: divalent metal cation transporter [Ktedonobacterales bacterium]